MLEIALTTDEKVKITARPVTATGRPAQIDGRLSGILTSGEGNVVEDPSDPLSVFFVSGDSPGTTTFLVTADADLGEGVITIEESVTATVSGAQAAALGLAASPPEPK